MKCVSVIDPAWLTGNFNNLHFAVTTITAQLLYLYLLQLSPTASELYDTTRDCSCHCYHSVCTVVL
jgi:hypothetical protein